MVKEYCDRCKVEVLAKRETVTLTKEWEAIENADLEM